jgi:hypothetical protein
MSMWIRSRNIEREDATNLMLERGGVAPRQLRAAVPDGAVILDGGDPGRRR